MTCYKCGSNKTETTPVKRVGHTGEHVKCLDCKAEKFYPKQS